MIAPFNFIVYCFKTSFSMDNRNFAGHPQTVAAQRSLCFSVSKSFFLSRNEKRTNKATFLPSWYALFLRIYYVLNALQAVYGSAEYE